MSAVVVSLYTRGVYDQVRRVGLGETVGGAGIVRLADRTHAGRVGRQSLNARAFSPLAHLRCAAPVFAPCGARQPSLLGSADGVLPIRGGHLAWSRYRTTRPGRSTVSWVVVRPCGASTGGALPPPVTGAGAPENAGAFSNWRLPQPSARPAWAGAASGAAPRWRLASRPMRFALTAGVTHESGNRRLKRR